MVISWTPYKGVPVRDIHDACSWSSLHAFVWFSLLDTTAPSVVNSILSPGSATLLYGERVNVSYCRSCTEWPDWKGTMCYDYNFLCVEKLSTSYESVASRITSFYFCTAGTAACNLKNKHRADQKWKTSVVCLQWPAKRKQQQWCYRDFHQQSLLHHYDSAPAGVCFPLVKRRFSNPLWGVTHSEG